MNKRSKVDQWDVLISMIGTIGETYLEKNSFINYAIKNIGLFKSKNKDKGYWLYYYLKSFPAKEYIHMNKSGTTQEYVTLGSLRKFPIAYPTQVSELKKIISILNNLDEKIDINRQINQTLEEIGQAIFKHWFVHFEFPDENGNPYKSSGGELVDSELGAIPKGWEVGEVRDIIEFVYGKGLTKNKRIVGRIPVYGSNGITDFHNEALVKGPGIIIGRKGTVGSINISHTDFWPIDTTYYVLSKKDKIIFSWYYLLNTLNLEKMNVHSAVPGLNRNDVYELPICIPLDYELIKFEQISKVIFKKINLNLKEIESLSKIRDSLLPKLMSGKIRVNIPEEATAK